MKVQHPVDWQLSRKPSRRAIAPMGAVYSPLSEEERQVIRIEIGNGTGIRAVGAMLGRSASTIGRQIRRNAWLPSNGNGSYRPYRPKRLKTGPWTGRYCIGRARAAQGRTASGEATQAVSSLVRARCGRRWPRGWGAATRRCLSAAGCASCGRMTGPCVYARKTIYQWIYADRRPT